MCETRSRKRRYDSIENSKTVKAVFKKDDLDDSMSTSDWGLVIEEHPKRRNHAIKLGEEPLSLTCEWDYCFEHHKDYIPFIKHLKQHLYISPHRDDETDKFYCSWTDCDFADASYDILRQHVIFHGYHTKLKNIGQNMLNRLNLPNCTQDFPFDIPVYQIGYICEWQDCHKKFGTVFDYLEHIKIHIYYLPRRKTEGSINCLWKGCKKRNFPTQYKLSEHVRMHSQERIVACPTCGNLFSNKTKFCDHRKRQTPKNQQSYLCSQCSKYFPSERLLRDHMRLHINHYKCTMCDMTCPKPSILANHIRYRHLKVKPYKCEDCDYTCVTKHNLEQHVHKHNENSLFKCDECEFRCRSSYGLKRHEEKRHGKEWTSIYECHTCKSRFIRGGWLTKHLMKAHNYHWPSGHSRFSYKEDQDGIFRLQTVRYETLEVTEEIIRGNGKAVPDFSNVKFNVLKRITDDANEIQTFDVVLDGGDEENEEESKQVVITIDDLDVEGNLMKRETVEAREVIQDPVAGPSS